MHVPVVLVGVRNLEVFCGTEDFLGELFADHHAKIILIPSHPAQDSTTHQQHIQHHVGTEEEEIESWLRGFSSEIKICD